MVDRKKVLLLVGGGHSHVQVVRNLRHDSGAQCILISEAAVAVYSGMLPAVVAGLTPHSNSLVYLQPLCEAHNFHFVQGKVVRVEPSTKRVFFNAPYSTLECSLRYDVLSINIGSCTRELDSSVDTRGDAHSLPLVVHTRPILQLESSVCTFERLAKKAGLKRALVAVVGAGAAGIELALALEARLRRSIGDVILTLVSKHDAIGSQFGNMAGAAVVAECKKRAIQVRFGRNVQSVHGGVIRLDDGSKLSYDMAVVATGAASHDVSRNMGLQLDEDGWIVVDKTLRCKRQDDIFAAGDCISFDKLYGNNFPPKAGVYAVREGPVLMHNLQQRLNKSQDMLEFVPQASFLSLLSTGDGSGIGFKYGLAFKGTWVYHMKNFIDERWQERFRVDKGKKGRGDGDKAVEILFDGEAAEGAASLLCSEDINEHDSFEQQLSVLRRMDVDQQFREKLLQCVDSGPQTIAS
ncbi:unnamed protein product [Agarophyton chilense]